MGTPHNEAEKGEIAKRVLMPGDPLRAKYIAEHFLEDAVCFTSDTCICEERSIYQKIKYFIDFKKTWPKGHVFLLRTQECFENFLVKCSYLIYNILNQKLEKVKNLKKMNNLKNRIKQLKKKK